MDEDEKPKLTARDKAELLVQMTKEAKQLTRKLHASACIVICMFEDEGQIRVQDAGMFPMPPVDFYDLLQQAHKNGQLGVGSPKKILRPN
jgi:hypothetical protein